MDTEIKNIIPFIISQNNKKEILRCKSNKISDLYAENNTILIKEINEDENKWRDVLCLWIGRLNIAKISLLPKSMYRFNGIPIKIPASFFFIYRYRQITLKLISKVKRTRIAKTFFKIIKWVYF